MIVYNYADGLPSRTGILMTHVPYRGAGRAALAVNERNGEGLVVPPTGMKAPVERAGLKLQ